MPLAGAHEVAGLEPIIGNGLFIWISKGSLHPAYADIFAVIERGDEGLDV